MDERDQLEEIIREIATKHGIAVSRDDPILILQTINNRLLLDSAKAQQAMLDRYKDELEALTLRWGTDAKGKAERILTASLSASKETMSALMDEMAQRTAATVAAEIDAALDRVIRPVSNVRRIAVLNVIAACITVMAATIALWVLPN
ncbi:MAG: conjugal transfer protein TraM [Pseudomonadota bacterium]